MNSGEATVVKNAGSHYLLSRLPDWDLFPAVLRGKVRLKASEITNPIAVGDRVKYDWADAGSAVITEILPRRHYVIRRSTNLSRQAHIIAANVDRAYLVVSLYFPEVKLPFLDRILVTCELYGIPATIVLSKTDMYREMAADEIAHFRSIYEGAGYPVIETSVKTGEGISAIREACEGRVNLFSGESGVGKSSLIKALDPSLDPKIGAISSAQAHHFPVRDVPALFRRLRNRLPRHPGLRPGGCGEGGDWQVLPGDAAGIGRLPLHPLHAHSRARLRGEGRRGRGPHLPGALQLLPGHVGRG